MEIATIGVSFTEKATRNVITHVKSGNVISIATKI